MIPLARHVLVTGAGGFIGAKLVAALLAHEGLAHARFTLTDTLLEDGADARVNTVRGDIADPAIRLALVKDGPDLVFHLAGILGGAAEVDYDLARRINVDASLTLIEMLRNPAVPPRVVFASSIAVFGPPLPSRVDDDTMPFPTMTYGAQKRMIEIAIEQFSARGWIDGIALRLPGIVARPGADARLKSAFLNSIFHQVATGADATLPVSAAGTTWMISVQSCVDALIHAALLEPGRLGRQRAITLPAQTVSFGELIAAIRERFPASGSRVDYAPDPAIEAQFGSQPPLATPLADLLGFVHDGNVATLVARALRDGGAAWSNRASGFGTGNNLVVDGRKAISDGK